MIFAALARIFYMCLLCIETLVSLRFVFLLIGANDSNYFVNLIYELSGIFVDPFVGIVEGDWRVGQFYIDVDALIALVLFMIIGFVVVEIIHVFSPKQAR